MTYDGAFHASADFQPIDNEKRGLLLRHQSMHVSLRYVFIVIGEDLRREDY